MGIFLVEEKTNNAPSASVWNHLQADCDCGPSAFWHDHRRRRVQADQGL